MDSKRVIAIVGTATSSREFANAEPPEVERWSLYGYSFLKQLDRLFELHGQAHFIRNEGASSAMQHWQALADAGCPVYMQNIDPAVPLSVRYPFEEITVEFGSAYFTSSIAFMFALAIYEGVDEIHLYGVDMHNWQEYADQRACTEYYMGIARGRGIKVVLPDNCPLLTGPIYAYADGGALDLGDLDVRIRTLTEQEIKSRETMAEAHARADELILLRQRIENTATLQHIMDSRPFEYVAPKGVVEAITNGTAKGSRKVQAKTS